MNNVNLSLFKYTEADFDDYQVLVADGDVMQYISGDGLTVTEARTKFDSILEINAADEHLGYFKVSDDKGLFIGDAKLERYKHDPSFLEIGYILKKDFWGKGFGSSICRILLERAERLYPQVDILGIIDPENSASKRLLEKFGFVSFFVGIEDDVPTEKLILRKSVTVK